MPRTLQLSLLGGFRVAFAGDPDPASRETHVTDFASAKTQALLAYLACTGRRHSRDALATLLWSESGDEAARTSLRQSLASLKRLLGPYLLIERDAVEFNTRSPHTLDVRQFETWVRGDVQTQRDALALYHGDLLRGMAVKNAPEFEEWLIVERERLRRLAVSAHRRVAEAEEREGDAGRALEHLRALVALEPLDEPAHRHLMLLLARSGQRAAALAQFEACRRALDRELGVPPEAATARLRERIHSAHAIRHVPAETTPFVGREAELAKLAAWLGEPACRLITIAGLGGAGKTRLALQAARAAVGRFLHGVCFVSLAPVQDAANVATSVLDGLSVLPAGSEPSDAALRRALADKELLLILDNVEHVRDACAALLADVLKDAPDVKCIVTSRERLGLQMEWTLALEGLPGDGDDSPAVRLFQQAASRALGSEFAPDPAVARICDRLQGLPLAIQLAAPWVQLMTTAQIEDELGSDPRLLSTTMLDVDARHRSLRAVFDHSWARLSPAEQAAFRQLSVFVGGFRRESAESVAGATSALLSTLVDKSLLALNPDGRYTRHPLLWQFSVEKLAELPEERRSAEARHVSHFAAFLQAEAARMVGGGQVEALAAIEAEIENVRAAWQRMLDPLRPERLNQAVDGLYHFVIIRSRFREGAELFRAARVALERHAPADRASRLALGRVMAREGRFMSSLSRYAEASALLDRSLDVLRDLGAGAEIAFALGHAGGIARLQGDLDLAERRLEECLDLRRMLGDVGGQAIAWLELAGAAFMREDFDAARRRCLEGLGFAEQAADVQTTAHLLTGLSLSHRELGDFDQARAYGARSLEMYERLDDRYGVLQASLTLGELDRRLGNTGEARRLIDRAVAVSQDIGDRSGEADGHFRLGQIAADAGRRADALAHFRRALSLARDIHETPMMLDALLEIGCLLAEADSPRAARLLAFVLAQPQLADQRRQRAADASARVAPAASPPATVGEAIRLAGAA